MLRDVAQFFHFQLSSVFSSFDWKCLHKQYSQILEVAGAKLQMQKFMIVHKCLEGPEWAKQTFPIPLIYTNTAESSDTAILSLHCHHPLLLFLMINAYITLRPLVLIWDMKLSALLLCIQSELCTLER